MKRLHIILPLILGLVIVASACNKSDETPKTMLEIEKLSYTIEGEESDFEIIVRANTTFTCNLPEDEQHWISHKSTRELGGGISALTFHATANTSDDYRDTKIYFSSSDGTVKQSVDVSQAPIAKIILDSNIYTVSYKEQSFEIEMSSNTEFEVDIECTGEWIKLAESRALKSYTLTFDIAENNTDAERKALITIEGGGTKQEILVTQSPMPTSNSIRLQLTHTESQLTSPMWYGFDIAGSVSWGDDSTDTWSEEIEHVYADEMQRSTLFDMEGVLSFTIAELGSIDAIEITYIAE